MGSPQPDAGARLQWAMTANATPASPLDALKPVAGRVLEAALNRAIALDPETRDALRPLDGRRVELALQSPSLALQLRVDGERLVVGPVEEAGEPDLSVRSTLGALLGQLPALLGARQDDAPPVGGMRISGDADLARRLQRLAERFDPDWQQPFAAVFGDVLGVQVANACASALKQARTLGGEFAGSAAEYVVEESRDVVGRDELAAFHDDVDGLRDDFERLAARVARLDGDAA
jgi:ubiquinone biosynthesis protein UbiJ